MKTIPEPVEGTIVCWFDPNDDLYAVYHRTDTNVEYEGDPKRWYNADQHGDGSDTAPIAWSDLLAEMESNRGPLELISNGRLEAVEVPA